MNTPPPLTRALDDAVSAVAVAIESYYRTAGSSGTLSLEVKEALSRAMRTVSEASRLEFEQRRREVSLPETPGGTESPLLSRAMMPLRPRPASADQPAA